MVGSSDREFQGVIRDFLMIGQLALGRLRDFKLLPDATVATSPQVLVRSDLRTPENSVSVNHSNVGSNQGLTSCNDE
jgi:hypothetical protein